MKIEKLTNCPSCGSGKIVHFTDIPDYYFSKEVFPIDECLNCGLRFTQNRPTADEIGGYYDSTNYASHDSGKKTSPFLKAYNLARDLMFGEKYKLIKQFKPEWKKVLDYGTGEGFFVEYLKQKGKNVVGIEPSEVARVNFKKRTSEDLYPDIESVPGDARFDVITLWHVLEHIHTLRETMTRLVSHIENKGIMVIAVPNQKSKDAQVFGKEWAAWDVPRHLYHWDQKSIEHFMTSLGLSRIYTSQLPLDPLYIGIISAKYQEIGALKGIMRGISSYFHGRNNPSEGSTLLTIWMKNQ
jgi:SAM-dependent methyltransferase